MQPDIGEPLRLDRGQRLRHAVDERLDADEAGARLLLGFGDQMLAAAEADFQAHLIDRDGEQLGEIGRRRRRKIDGQPRQQGIERSPRCGRSR